MPVISSSYWDLEEDAVILEDLITKKQGTNLKVIYGRFMAVIKGQLNANIAVKVCTFFSDFNVVVQCKAPGLLWVRISSVVWTPNMPPNSISSYCASIRV